MTDCTVTTCFCRLLHHTPTLHLAVPDPSSSAHHQPGSAADDVAGNVLALAARHGRSYRGPAAGRALTDCQGQCMLRRAFCSSCTRPLPPPAARPRGAAAKRRGPCVLQCTIAKRRAGQSCGDRSECALGTHDASPLLGGEVVNIFDRHPCRQALGMGLQPKGEDLEHALPCPPSSGQKIVRARPQKKKIQFPFREKPRVPRRSTGRKACSAAAGSAEGCAMGSRACWRCVRWAS